MRLESSVTSLSWIPQGAVEGFNRLSFGLGVAHFDPPPPEVLGNLDELEAADRFRMVNRLEGWIEVQDGRIVDLGQSGGGRINVTRVGYGPASIAFTPIALPDLRPAQRSAPPRCGLCRPRAARPAFPPRRVRHEPYVQIAGPVTWSTLALTIHADGTSEPRLVGASSFPRHWVYDHAGRLVAKSGYIDHDTWWREAFGTHTPWGRGLGPYRDRGGVGLGAPAVGGRDRCQAAVPAAPGRPDPGRAGPARRRACSCCSTGCCGWRSTASR